MWVRSYMLHNLEMLHVVIFDEQLRVMARSGWIAQISISTGSPPGNQCASTGGAESRM